MKQFDKVPIKIPAKNVFDLSHDVKASYNFDYLYPFLCQNIYPGDTFNCRAEVFVRTMPALAPIMHNVDMHIFFIFCPHRLEWDENKKADFKTFITGGEDGLQNPPLPVWNYSDLWQTDTTLAEHRSLVDHMGFPTVSPEETVHTSRREPICALPFRAYQTAYNELFRNQNVENEIEFSHGAGAIPQSDYTTLFTMRKKKWEKDYFTSCLPFAQRGEAVKLPIDFDSVGVDQLVRVPVTVNAAQFGNDITEYGLVGGTFSNSKNNIAAEINASRAGEAVNLKGSGVINAGEIAFTGLSVGTINDFRYCLRLQQWLENNARCGSRYIEQLLSHFGVVSSDARLQRPELLGGGKIPLIFTDVEQTSYGTGSSDNVLGDLGGKGTLYGKTNGFKKYFEEHGTLLGILCIIPRTSYSQGIPRQWTAMDKTDWYFPEFAHLGEQAVLNKEIYYELTRASQIEKTPDDVFGYQGRFTELRYIPSSVHGEMRGDLQYWHFGRLFDAVPALNEEFVTANTRANVWAMSDIVNSGYDPFVAQIHLDIKAVRPLPEYAVPTL